MYQAGWAVAVPASVPSKSKSYTKAEKTAKKKKKQNLKMFNTEKYSIDPHENCRVKQLAVRNKANTSSLTPIQEIVSILLITLHISITSMFYWPYLKVCFHISPQ